MARFEKGHKPANPIRNGERRGISTEFKKGIIPKNKLPVGSVTIRKHKFDSPRKWIKVAEPNTWIPNAVFVWTKLGGNIPKGFIIHHANENTLDDSPGNLSLVSRAYHINLHRDKLLAMRKQRQV